ncbi:peroxisomal targeting signal 2 receptor [Malassezia yamatoensis]|uniref:Peroxin-7 n=1 Tax=Malassezia yamatoensis TaxID=253288 RepID=A0AAJ6CG69_9BASI|nr:peroxisomal targeting signal 2 receptor [Malassezia yamatoensis]
MVHVDVAPRQRSYQTPGFAGYNVAWSPFFAEKFAVVGAANYGLVGNGRLHIFGRNASLPLKFFDSQDGMFDLAWSELHENQIASACGDGSIKLWDISLNEHPIRNWAEHTREVQSLDWNNMQKELFASSSWDGTVKIVRDSGCVPNNQWNPDIPQSIQTIQAHSACVYKCAWSPHNPTLIASASGDGSVAFFDLRNGHGPGGLRPVTSLPVGGEVLSMDWNKYRPMTLATGSTDRAVKIWDGRMPSTAPQTRLTQPLTEKCVLTGHQYAVRGLSWSTHQPSVLASAGYDMSVRIWNVDDAQPHGAVPVLDTPRNVYPLHKEFVVGLAYSLFEPNVIASTSWDCETHIWPTGV